MASVKNVKIELDNKTIQAIAKLCEVSGLEVPALIDLTFIESVTKRLKDIIVALKNQSENNNAQIEDYKKLINSLKRQIEELKSDLESVKIEQENASIAITKASEPNIQEQNHSFEEHFEEIEPEHKEKKEIREIKEHRKIDKDAEHRSPIMPSKIQNILIIANLGVIMHQLKILFSKFGCKVSLVKSYQEAIGELKQQAYECIIFDMSTMTENDYMLVEALRKATEICNTETLVVTLITPSKEKRVIKKLKSKGADIVIEKVESWHMHIIEELKLA